MEDWRRDGGVRAGESSARIKMVRVCAIWEGDARLTQAPAQR